MEIMVKAHLAMDNYFEYLHKISYQQLNYSKVECELFIPFLLFCSKQQAQCVPNGSV